MFNWRIGVREKHNKKFKQKLNHPDDAIMQNLWHDTVIALIKWYSSDCYVMGVFNCPQGYFLH